MCWCCARFKRGYKNVISKGVELNHEVRECAMHIPVLNPRRRQTDGAIGHVAQAGLFTCSVEGLSLELGFSAAVGPCRVVTVSL